MSLIDKALAIAEESEDGWLIKALINEYETMRRERDAWAKNMTQWRAVAEENAALYRRKVNDDHHPNRA